MMFIVNLLFQCCHAGSGHIFGTTALAEWKLRQIVKISLVYNVN